MLKRNILKDECFKCGAFDNTKTHRYKCAIPGSCPGKDWPMSRRQRLIREKFAKTGKKSRRS